jgi:antitoxin (DNA-binding transcriptional repressor) of toxin-antitoxin stability system
MHKAKTHLSKYARRVKAGETILLCERNVPFDELRPLSESPEDNRDRPLGMDQDKVQLADDWDSNETNQKIADMFGVFDKVRKSQN